jgi:hypothetical protein
MNLREGVVAHLKADPGVAALVGPRVYHETKPQSPTYPAICYAKSSVERYMTLAGPSSLVKARVAVEVWARTSADMIAVGDAVKDALDGVTGSLGGLSIQFCEYDSEADLSEFEGDRADRHLSLEFVITYNE